ncbi:MAG: ATP-binding protein [Fidelibacterota bacterium]
MEYLIKRNKIEEIRNHLNKKEITLISGARQTGKTTIMKKLQKELMAKGKNTLFLNLDFEMDKEYFTSQSQLIQKLQLEFGSNNAYIFVDEIQRKENAGLFLKGIYDMELPYKFIISGSGSIELKEKIHESLFGRKQQFELKPVTFSEFLNYKTNYRYENKLVDFCRVESNKRELILKEYLNFGGYPRVVTSTEKSEKKMIIAEIVSSYINMDISFLLNLTKTDEYLNMIKLLAGQAGKVINYSKLSKNAGVSLPTLKKYIWYAEKTFCIHRITPFFKNISKEIRKSPIFYFNDLGFSNYIINKFGSLSEPEDFAFIFQNFIYTIIAEKLNNTSSTIHFWRTTDKTEVDFVINTGDNYIPIEIKYSHLKTPSVKRSMRSFIDKYNPQKALIINLNLTHKIQLRGTELNFLPYWDFINYQIN